MDKDMAKAFSLGTPRLPSKRTKPPSLSPTPPIVIGKNIITETTPNIQHQSEKAISIPTALPIIRLRIVAMI